MNLEDSGSMKKERKVYIKVLPTINNPSADNPSDIIYVNDDINPILIHNQYFTGHVVFRVLNYSGLTPVLDDARLPPIHNTKYFSNRGRKFSMQVEGRFRHNWSADDILFGSFFQKPLLLHKGFQIAIAMARYIDPALVGDIFSDQPYLCSPMVCGMNYMGVSNAPKSLKEASESTAKYYISDEDFHHEFEKTKNKLPQSGWDCETVSLISSSPKDVSYSQSGDSIDSNSDDLANAAKDEDFQEKLSLRLSKVEIGDSVGSTLENVGKIKLNRCTKCLEFSVDRPLLLPPWDFGGDLYLNENLIDFEQEKGFFEFMKRSPVTEDIKDLHMITAKDLKISKKNSKKRRNYFLNEENRKNFIFENDKCYGFEFTSSYADLNSFVLNLGITIEVEKYINNQPVIYEARTREGVIFWRVELGLTEDY